MFKGNSSPQRSERRGTERLDYRTSEGRVLATWFRKADRVIARTPVGRDRAIGERQGRHRSVHLAAHFETLALLYSDQIALNQQLRGHAGLTAPAQHHDHERMIDKFGLLRFGNQ